MAIIDRRHVVAMGGLGLGIAATARHVAAATPRTPLRIDVRTMGATGDGATRDTVAFQQALDRCSMLGGGEVVVPAGAYLIGAVTMGPATTLRIERGATVTGSPDPADYPIRQVRWEGRFVAGRIGLVNAENADHIALIGDGRLVGSPAFRERVDRASGLRNPALVEVVGCDGVEMAGLDTRQNAMWSIHPLYCRNVHLHDLQVTGGADGIDVDSCAQVTIERCRFDTGDDCIALKSGRGDEGWRLARPTSDVRIADCTFVDHRWACLAIGSEMSGGISGVRVERCRVLGAGTHAIYLKGRVGRGGFVEDVAVDDLDVAGTTKGLLRLNFADSGKQDDHPVPGADGMPVVRDFRFTNIRVHDVPTLVDGVDLNPARPLDGLTLSGIRGTARAGIRLAHVRHAVIEDVDVVGLDGPLLAVADVDGRGLADAVTLAAHTAG